MFQETLEQIKRRALEITADIETRIGKYSAEIIADCTPQWHLIETWVGKEYKASDFLIQRHFGVFLPTFDPNAILMLDGINLCAGRGLIFPGHLFVFVWDIEYHWRRICACPGVWDILLDRSEHPVIVPDKDMDFIQALQFGLCPHPMSKRKRLKAKYEQKQKDNTEEQVTLTTPSRWRGIEHLDSDGRNQLLHKALGLEMLTP